MQKASPVIRAGMEEDLEEALMTRARRVFNLSRRAGENGLILFLTYNYEKTRQRVETTLATRLAAIGLQPVAIDLRREKLGGKDLVSILLHHASTSENVLMVTGLGQEGATAYRSLNYQRERLVEGRVKVFFWLTGEEVRSMANLAPDFWAMKHRIIDFPEAAGDEQVSTAYQAAFSFISQTHFESGEELAGMIATREAILEGLRPGNTVERRDVLVTLGGLYYHSGRYSDAEATLVKALKLSQRRKRIDVVSTITHNLGALFLAQGRLEEALDYLTKSMEISESLGDQRGISESLHELGALAQKQGRLEESLNYSTRSLEISEDLGEQEGIAVSLYELGALAQKQGRLDEALDYCNKSLDIFYKLGDPQGILYSLHVLGRLAHDQGRLEEALDYYTRSSKISEDLGEQRGIAYNLGQLGLLKENEGKFAEAADRFRQALAIFERLNTPDAEKLRGYLRHVQELMGQKPRRSRKAKTAHDLGAE